MDTRHNDLTGASIPPFAGGMDDDPVPDPPTLSAVPSPPRQTAAPVPGYGQYQVAAPASMSAPAGATAFGGVTAPVSDYDSFPFPFPFTSPTYMFYPGVYTVNAADLGDYIEAESATLRAMRTEYQYGADPLMNVSIEITYSASLLDAALDEVVAQANSCVTPPGNLDATCPFALQSRTLSLLEVTRLPTELKPGEWEPSRFQGYVTFRIQWGAGTTIQDIKTTAIATPEFDDDGKLLLDASGKPHFWVEFEAE